MKGQVIIGKDVLELLTGAMYVDPLSVYREYIQNASDSIDDATDAGFYSNNKEAKIDVSINPTLRSIIVRDNGAGVLKNDFLKVLTAVGGSQKRGTHHRGFRGVGRLAGLGYAQVMVFRSKAIGDDKVSELQWDNRRLRSILADPSWNGDLEDAVLEITEHSELPADEFPEHFFEVELKKVIRYKNDQLLNQAAVEDYIAQVCPVPFDPEFKFSEQINNCLEKYGVNSTYSIFVNESDSKITKRYGNNIEVKPGVTDCINKITIHELPGSDGDVAAIAWILDHNYIGAIPKSEGIAGLRVRKGNIQVGPERIAIDVFPEPRFNSWTAGEVHILSDKIVPNGRRDHFEQNLHFSNLIGQLTPIGRKIGQDIRRLSGERHRHKLFEFQVAKTREQVEIILQDSLIGDRLKTELLNLENEIENLEVVANKARLSDEEMALFQIDLNQFKEVLGSSVKHENFLPTSSEEEKATCKKVFSLIYEHLADKRAAKHLVEKIVLSIESEQN